MKQEEIISKLKAEANPELIEKRKKKFGIEAHNALGLTQKQLNDIIKGIRKDQELALQLFDSGIYEARILCAKLFPPSKLTESQAEAFVQQLENWEICDTYSMKLFAYSTIFDTLIHKWHNRQAEFEKRAAYATIAGLTMADKKLGNIVFQNYFPLIEAAASDERIYVKKAVNWALRSIGKRNPDLRKGAIELAEKILRSASKSAQWIAKDALKELQNPKTRIADHPRSIYRKS